jgi:hypothetical protein
MGDPLYRGPDDPKEPPCETGKGCPFEETCDRSPIMCGELWQGEVDRGVDMLIDEAREERKGHHRGKS